MHITGINIIGLIAQEQQHLQAPAFRPQHFNERFQAPFFCERLSELLCTQQQHRRIGGLLA